MSSTTSYTNRGDTDIKRVFLPVCALDFQTLRQYAMKENVSAEFPRDMQNFAQNGNKVYMVQGSKIWIGDFDSMIFNDYVDASFSVYGLEPIFNGVFVFSDKGFFWINGDNKLARCQTEKIESEKVIAHAHGNNMVAGITDRNEAFVGIITIPENGAPYPVLAKISEPVDRVSWGGSPKVCFAGGTIWISREDDIFGFKNGAWVSRYVFDGKTIRNICEFKGRLVVSFYDSTVFTFPKIDPSLTRELE